MAEVLSLQNKLATLNEYNVGYVLEKYRVEYFFQVSYWGGRNIRGGRVLDFLILNPLETPLEVFGNYWHTGQLGSGDRLKLVVFEQFFGKKVLIAWGKETMTIEDTTETLRKLKVI